MTLDVVFFLVVAFLAFLVGVYFGKKIIESVYAKKFDRWIISKERGIREDAIKRSRAVIGGKLAEQFSPFFPDFKYDPTEVRFIGTPIDMIIFPGLAEDKPRKIVFMEIKNNTSELTGRERKIKELVKKKKVQWEEFKVNTKNSPKK